MGFRSPTIEPTKGQGVVRIVVLGRSITMGSGVTDEEVYTARLQELLNQRSPERRYEVLNFAVGGYELPQMSAVYDEFAADLDPDLVLVAMTARMYTWLVPDASFRLPERKWSNLRELLIHLFVGVPLNEIADSGHRDHVFR